MSVLHAHGDSEKIREQNFTNTQAWCKKKKNRDVIFQRSRALRFLSQVNPGVSVLEDAQSVPRMAHRGKWRSVIHKSLWNAVNESRGAVKYPNIHLFVQMFPSFSLLLGSKYSMTLLLITSACQGNFVRQNRNALFWWDCDPWACPRVLHELNVTVARF